MNTIDEEAIPQMPDLLFSRYCEEKFEVNRGILNTIDQWFYMQGLIRIVPRRKSILQFFFYIRMTEKTNKKIKFGHGGLTTKLNKFWLQQGKKVIECLH